MHLEVTTMKILDRMPTVMINDGESMVEFCTYCTSNRGVRCVAVFTKYPLASYPCTSTVVSARPLPGLQR